MKKISLLLSLLLFPACHKLDKLIGTEAPSTVAASQPKHHSGDIYLIAAGQSNASSLNEETTVGYGSVTGGVHLRFSFDGNDVDHGSEWFVPGPIDGHTMWGITWIKLGDLIVQKTHQDVWIDVVAKGSTNSTNWREDGLAKVLFKRASETHPRAIMWVQGESDTTAGTTKKAYIEFVKWLVSNTSAAQFFVAITSVDSTHRIGVGTPVNLAQHKLVREAVASLGPDIDQMRIDSPQLFTGSLIHFYGLVGYEAHAEAWYRALERQGVI